MTKDSVNAVRLGLILYTLASWNTYAQVPIGAVPDADSPFVKRVTVPFVTVRGIEQDNKGLRYYGVERGDASAGECTAALDAREKRQITSLQQRTLDRILDQFAGSDGRVTVYLHGYNVGFEQSCREAALLTKRVGLEDRLLLFSWPAEGKVAGYVRDVGDIDWSVVPLMNLLLALVDRLGSQNVDVIGHSLGAKGVVDAVIALGEQRGRTGVLGRVILIAPDLDGDIFVRDFAKFDKVASAVTVYVSSQDRALKASRNVRSEPRLGEGTTDLSELEGIDIVEVPQRRWKWRTGHLYHLQNDAVAEDLREVLSGPPRSLGRRTIGGGRN